MEFHTCFQIFLHNIFSWQLTWFYYEMYVCIMFLRLLTNIFKECIGVTIKHCPSWNLSFGYARRYHKLFANVSVTCYSWYVFPWLTLSRFAPLYFNHQRLFAHLLFFIMICLNPFSNGNILLCDWRFEIATYFTCI